MTRSTDQHFLVLAISILVTSCCGWEVHVLEQDSWDRESHGFVFNIKPLTPMEITRMSIWMDGCCVNWCNFSLHRKRNWGTYENSNLLPAPNGRMILDKNEWEVLDEVAVEDTCGSGELEVEFAFSISTGPITNPVFQSLYLYSPNKKIVSLGGTVHERAAYHPERLKLYFGHEAPPPQIENGITTPPGPWRVVNSTMGSVPKMLLGYEVPISPTPAPTSFPSAMPTPEPSPYPTSAPSVSPSHVPSQLPSNSPTSTPTIVLTSSLPTASPSALPTLYPTLSPTTPPTTSMPTFVPSTSSPTTAPSEIPTVSPSMAPSYFPTTSFPTMRPTASPTTSIPTEAPTPTPLVLIPECVEQQQRIQRDAEINFPVLYQGETQLLLGFEDDCAQVRPFSSNTTEWDASDSIIYEFEIKEAEEFYDACVNRFSGSVTIAPRTDFRRRKRDSPGGRSADSDTFKARLHAKNRENRATYTIAEWDVQFQQDRGNFVLSPLSSCEKDIESLRNQSAALNGRHDLGRTAILFGINRTKCPVDDLFSNYFLSSDGEANVVFTVNVIGNNSADTMKQQDDILWNDDTGKVTIIFGTLGSFRIQVMAETSSTARSFTELIYEFNVTVMHPDTFGASCGIGGTVIEDGIPQNDEYDCACQSGFTVHTIGTQKTCVATVDSAVAETVEEESSSIYAVGGSVGGFSLVLILYIFWRSRVARQRRMKENIPVDFSERLQQMVSMGLIAAAPEGNEGEMKQPTELKRSKLTLLEILGEGAFGEVRKGVYNPPDTATPEYTVAVKVLKGDPSNEEREELLKEALITAQFDHANVIALVGTVTSGSPYLLVLQFCEGGSLLSILRSTKTSPKPHPVETLLGYCVGIAAGMEYLSGLHFVHRDLAARNILVDSRKAPKIADFGLSRELDYSAYYKGNAEGKMPIRWTAPECIQENKFSAKSDVWAFGITMIEIWSRGETPYRGWMNAYVIEQVMARFKLPIPLECPDQVYFEAIVHCLGFEPGNRPTFAELHVVLTRLLKFKEALHFSPMQARMTRLSSLAGSDWTKNDMYDDFGASTLESAPQSTFSANHKLPSQTTGACIEPGATQYNNRNDSHTARASSDWNVAFGPAIQDQNVPNTYSNRLGTPSGADAATGYSHEGLAFAMMHAEQQHLEQLTGTPKGDINLGYLKLSSPEKIPDDSDSQQKHYYPTVHSPTSPDFYAVSSNRNQDNSLDPHVSSKAVDMVSANHVSVPDDRASTNTSSPQYVSRVNGGGFYASGSPMPLESSPENGYTSPPKV